MRSWYTQGTYHGERSCFEGDYWNAVLQASWCCICKIRWKLWRPPAHYGAPAVNANPSLQAMVNVADRVMNQEAMVAAFLAEKSLVFSVAEPIIDTECGIYPRICRLSLSCTCFGQQHHTRWHMEQARHLMITLSKPCKQHCSLWILIKQLDLKQF